MSLYVNAPPLARLALIDEAQAIRRLNEDSGCDRVFDGRGPLLNRLLQRRFGRKIRTMHGALPAFRPRDDAERAAAQQALAQRLDVIGADSLAASEPVSSLAAWVARGRPTAEGGPMVQTVVGRLFTEDFTGTDETWRAAKRIDAYLRADPLRAAWLSWTGLLGRALRTVGGPLDEDPHAVHAVAIAAHTLHRSLLQMQTVLDSPVERARIDEDRVALRCLRAPSSVPRVAIAPLRLPFRDDPVPAGTLVLFRLARASEARLDAETAFGGNGWSACPARGYVENLLRAVWRRASEERPQARHLSSGRRGVAAPGQRQPA